MASEILRMDVRLEDHDSGILGDGSGTSFADAWNDILDPRLRKG